ncbi:MAG: Yip1 family protein [Candidatus Omnitrophota bacterium]
MDFNAIIKRVTALITNPKAEWEIIKLQPMTTADIFTKYALILAAIPAIAMFIGHTLIGVSFGFGTFRYPIGAGLQYAIFNYIFSLVGVFVAAFIIDALAPSFGSVKDMNRSLKVVVFSYIPLWVAGVLFIIPTLGILVSLIGIYSLYLLYLGIKQLKEPPADKLMGYYIVSLVVMIVLFIGVGFIVASIALSGYYPNALRGF